MKRVCALCNKEMAAAGTSGEAPISNGICDDCASSVNFREMSLREYLDSIPAPVVLLDSERRVKVANRSACKYLGKNIPEIEGFTGGIVLECENARLPGGCGHTVHCSGCAIRKAVLDTLLFEKEYVKIPAYLNRQTLQKAGRIDLLISTEKIHGLVLLRIDEVRDEEGGLLANLKDDR